MLRFFFELRLFGEFIVDDIWIIGLIKGMCKVVKLLFSKLCYYCIMLYI